MIELKRTTKRKEPLVIELSNKVNKLNDNVEEISTLTNGLIDIIADNIVDLDGDN